jgi:DNA-directed RNA polymerase specialized sigma subunit
MAPPNTPINKDQDMVLWKTWKRTRAPSDLQALLRQMSGLIAKESSRWSGAIAREVLEIEAARLAKQAFETYDPKAGAKLSTHVSNYLQKMSRDVYTHQNLARLPEYQTLKVQTFQRAHSDLEGQFGRPPSTAELADHMSWSVAAVEHLRKQLRKESVESLDLKTMPASGRSDSDVMVDLVYHDLNPLQKSIFDHTTGYAGATILSGKELTDKLKITQGQLSYEKQKIISHVKSVIK